MQCRAVRRSAVQRRGLSSIRIASLTCGSLSWLCWSVWPQELYKFGKLRGSALVDVASGKVKEYKLPLIDINNSQYLGRIQVGEPRRGHKPQYFSVILDTGSSNLWINSDQCHSEACVLHRRFHPKQSRTYKKLAVEMSVQFGTGNIEGFLARDTFTLGPLRIQKQAFGQITSQVGQVFVAGKFDGILGLSFPSLSAAGYKPVFDNIMSQKLLTNNMFSFYFTTLPVQNSAILFGAPARELYHGELQWVQVHTPLYWQVCELPSDHNRWQQLPRPSGGLGRAFSVVFRELRSCSGAG